MPRWAFVTCGAACSLLFFLALGSAVMQMLIMRAMREQGLFHGVAYPQNGAMRMLVLTFLFTAASMSSSVWCLRSWLRATPRSEPSWARLTLQK